MKWSEIIGLLVVGTMCGIVLTLTGVVSAKNEQHKIQLEAALDAGRIATTDGGWWQVGKTLSTHHPEEIWEILIFPVIGDPFTRNNVIRATKANPDWEKYTKILLHGKVRFGIKAESEIPKKLTNNPGDYLKILEVQGPVGRWANQAGEVQ
jgi:hypothetical protein